MENNNNEMESLMVIVIEDDKIAGWALSKVLEDAGYDTMLAVAGEEIVEKVVKLESKPAAIISDFYLEGDMNGVESAREVANIRHSRILTIITSHGHNDKARALAHDAGYHFCPKPMDPERILGLLESEITVK